MSKLILIQGNYLATYLGKKQVATIECNGQLTRAAIKEIFSDGSFWVKSADQPKQQHD